MTSDERKLITQLVEALLLAKRAIHGWQEGGEYSHWRYWSPNAFDTIKTALTAGREALSKPE